MIARHCAAAGAHAAREQERFRAIVDQQTDLICRFRPDTILTFVNDTYARHFGRTPEQLIGRSFLELVPVEQREFVRAQVDSLYANPREMAYEHAAISADGGLRWHQWIDRLVADPQGHGMEFQSVGRDVTERHEADARSSAASRSPGRKPRSSPPPCSRSPASPPRFLHRSGAATIVECRRHRRNLLGAGRSPGFRARVPDLEHDELVKAEDSTIPAASQRIIALEREAAALLDDPRVFDFEHISTHPDYKPFRAWALRHGVRTVLQVPMVFGASIVGAYTVRFDRERSFDPQDLQLAKALALQATLAIRLTQLAEQAKSVAVSQERVAQLAQANRALTGTLDRLATEPSLDTALGHALAAVTHHLEAHPTLWLYDMVEGVAHLNGLRARPHRAGSRPSTCTRSARSRWTSPRTSATCSTATSSHRGLRRERLPSRDVRIPPQPGHPAPVERADAAGRYAIGSASCVSIRTACPTLSAWSSHACSRSRRRCCCTPAAWPSWRSKPRWGASAKPLRRSAPSSQG
jgi:PAS domain S-box-containing protein